MEQNTEKERGRDYVWFLVDNGDDDVVGGWMASSQINQLVSRRNRLLLLLLTLPLLVRTNVVAVVETKSNSEPVVGLEEPDRRRGRDKPQVVIVVGHLPARLRLLTLTCDWAVSCSWM